MKGCELPAMLAMIAGLNITGCVSAKLYLTPAQVKPVLVQQQSAWAFRYAPPKIQVMTQNDTDFVLNKVAPAGVPGSSAEGAQTPHFQFGEAELIGIQRADPTEAGQRSFLSAIEREIPPVNFKYYEDPADSAVFKGLRNVIGSGVVADYRTMSWVLFKSPSPPATFRLRRMGKGRF